MAFGQEENTGNINLPGTYKDPQSGKELHVIHNAGADALARLGWVRQADAEGVEAPNPELTPAMAAEKALNAAKEPTRADLEARATELGIPEPSKAPNRAALVEAIAAAEEKLKKGK